MPYLSIERCDEIFKDRCFMKLNVFIVAAAVFLEQNSKNRRAAELYALKKKGFIHDQTVDDNNLH